MQYKYELKKLSVNHNAIADWLIANPGRGQQGICAQEFGITQSWLSTLINQDAFQSLLKNKQSEIFDEVVVPLKDKIAGVAHRSVEKLGEILDATNDGRLVKDISDSMIKALGYGQANNAGVVIHNTTLTINQIALQEARHRQSQHYGKALEDSSKPESQTSTTSPKLQDNRKTEVGEARELRSEHVNSGTELQGDSSEGGEV